MAHSKWDELSWDQYLRFFGGIKSEVAKFYGLGSWSQSSISSIQHIHCISQTFKFTRVNIYYQSLHPNFDHKHIPQYCICILFFRLLILDWSLVMCSCGRELSISLCNPMHKLTFFLFMVDGYLCFFCNTEVSPLWKFTKHWKSYTNILTISEVYSNSNIFYQNSEGLLNFALLNFFVCYCGIILFV